MIEAEMNDILVLEESEKTSIPLIRKRNRLFRPTEKFLFSRHSLSRIRCRTIIKIIIILIIMAFIVILFCIISSFTNSIYSLESGSNTTIKNSTSSIILETPPIATIVGGLNETFPERLRSEESIFNTDRLIRDFQIDLHTSYVFRPQGRLENSSSKSLNENGIH